MEPLVLLLGTVPIHMKLGTLAVSHVVQVYVMLVECFDVTVGKIKQLFSSIIYMLAGRCAMYRRKTYLCILSISVCDLVHETSE